MAQEQVQKQKAKTRAEESNTEETHVDVANAELAESTDATLDSIDDVLDDQRTAVVPGDPLADREGPLAIVGRTSERGRSG